MSNPNENVDVVRYELEKVWKGRWYRAKRRLELETLHVAEIKKNMQIGAAIPSNTYGDALEAKSAALTEYARVLRVYTDLVVHGRIPEEQEAHYAGEDHPSRLLQQG